MELAASPASQRLAQGAEPIGRPKEPEAPSEGVSRATSPTATTDDDDSEPREIDRRRPIKKRKATYLVTKEEKEQLNREVKALEEHLATLKERVGLSGDRSLEKTAKSNVVLGSVLRQQQLLVANAQAGLSACMRGPTPSPLCSYIHLGIDNDVRHQTLLSIRDFKIQNCLDFVEARSQHLDLLQPFSSEEHFVDAEGNFCYTNFDVVQFSGVSSVREVYNAAIYHFLNEEITLSERLGSITVRDDYNAILDNLFNCRLSSVDENGVKTETNGASFAAFVETEQSPSGTSFAVFARDSVDADDLYPYNPSEYVRKDHSGAVVLTAMKRKKEVGESSATTEGSEDEEELVVVMRRAGYVKIHRPAFPLPDQTQQALLKGITDSCDIMLASMRSILARGL